MSGSDNSLEFRRLCDDELDVAYMIISDAVDWLLARGIWQWTVPLPRKIWQKRQCSGQNYALFCNGDLAVVFSLLHESDSHWKDELGCDEHWWLSTVATASEFRGQQMGRRAVAEASAFLQKKDVEYLCVDCVHGSGFLPAYYESLGFEFVAQKEMTYPQGPFDMVLMKKNLQLQ